MSTILGISLGHDAGVSLVDNGRVVSVLEAERLFRSKRYVLDLSTLTRGPRAHYYQFIDVDDLAYLLDLFLRHVGKTFDEIAVQNNGRPDEFSNLSKLLSRMGVKSSAVSQVSHHYSHAAAAFYSSSLSDAIVLSYDGMGNDGSTNLFHFSIRSGGRYLKRYPYQLGRAYTNLGYVLGILPDSTGATSGKTMGYTAYGEVISSWIEVITDHIRTFQRLPWKRQEGVGGNGRGYVCNTNRLDEIPELAGLLDTCTHREQQDQSTLASRLHEQVHKNLAATFQHVWTQFVMSLLSDRGLLTVSKNLLITGGCALNGITNSAAVSQLGFDQYHFISNPNDSGLASGAALARAYEGSPADFQCRHFSPYSGMRPFDAPPQSVPNGMIRARVSTEVLLELLAAIIPFGAVVGVFRGNSEVGPRALGNRSMIASPVAQEVRDRINRDIKKREWYRPFAPVVMEERYRMYFDLPQGSPYMSLIGHTKKEYRALLTAVTHVDGSARVQTVSREQNPFLHDLLARLEALGHFPILLNTSLNLPGQPIANTYSDAMLLLQTTPMDALATEEFFFCKRSSPIATLATNLLTRAQSC